MRSLTILLTVIALGCDHLQETLPDMSSMVVVTWIDTDGSTKLTSMGGAPVGGNGYYLTAAHGLVKDEVVKYSVCPDIDLATCREAQLIYIDANPKVDIALLLVSDNDGMPYGTWPLCDDLGRREDVEIQSKSIHWPLAQEHGRMSTFGNKYQRFAKYYSEAGYSGAPVYSLERDCLAGIHVRGSGFANRKTLINPMDHGPTKRVLQHHVPELF